MITLFIIIIAITCIYTASLIYYSNASFGLKLIALPLQLAFFIFISYQLILLAGAPINQEPDGKFTYIHHEITDQSNTIILWMYQQERGHRLYKIPYDREKAKQLQKAKNSRDAGNSTEGHFKPNGNGYSSLFISEPSLIHSQEMPKYSP